MSSTNREEILADFQACTGIEDVGESIQRLEEANWNLAEAVNRVIPQEIQALHSSDVSFRTTNEAGKPEVPGVFSAPLFVHSPPTLASVSVSDDIVALPSTSRSTRVLNFTVKYGVRNIPVVVCDGDTIGTIKSILQSQLGIPPCKQDLVGWQNANVGDHTRLATLNLPKENTLSLLAEEMQLGEETVLSEAEAAFSDRLTQNFKLNITDADNQKEFCLNYLGTKTVQQVREDVFSLTDIPVRNQLWTGWPEGSHVDGATLASVGVGYPCHQLSVSRRDLGSSSTASHLAKTKPPLVDLTSESSSSGAEEFEDASETFGMEDELFVHEMPSRRRLRPLIAEDVNDELEAVNSFVAEFRNRYGDNHASFFPGTLEDALREAFQKPAKDRKLLGVYLHHDGSILANVFCTQLLCAEAVVSYLASNFVMWGWDMTRDTNRERLLLLVTRHFGSVAAATVRNFALDQLPIMLVIVRVRSSTEVFTVIHGNVGLDELLTRLIQAMEVFSGQRQLEMLEEDQREAREQVKREQDEAYEASLLADRAKEETRRLEEEEKLRVVHEQKMEEQREARIRLEEEANRFALRQSLERQLPMEPDESIPVERVTHVKVRVPSGEAISRRFLSTEPLQVLLDFLTVRGYSRDEYKVLTSWPRKDLTLMDPTESLQQLNLCPQETLTLEER